MGILRIISIRVLIIAAMYYGFYLGYEGAKNVAVFTLWFIAIASWFSLNDNYKPTSFKKDHAYLITDIPILVALIWFGYIVLSIFWIMALVVVSASVKNAGKRKAEESKVQS